MKDQLVLEIKNLSLWTQDQRPILSEISMSLEKGSFLAILGENGAGKTTLLDLAMGFRKPNQGAISVLGSDPFLDPFVDRNKLAYLSEKVDLPGDWSSQEFLDFNSKFFSDYDRNREAQLKVEYKIQAQQRIGNMSAGEIRRVQIVAALSGQPKLILIDEITAVLDILGRHRFMRHLSEMNKKTGTTIVLATNIVEDLDQFITHVALISKGSLSSFDETRSFLTKNPGVNFSDSIAQRLAKI